MQRAKLNTATEIIEKMPSEGEAILIISSHMARVTLSQRLCDQNKRTPMLNDWCAIHNTSTHSHHTVGGPT